MTSLEILENLVLAPYILKATTLIQIARKVGGNQFRHSFMVLGILVDYKQYDSILLKASLLHDLLEDVPETKIDELKQIDSDGEEVVNLVLEVSKQKNESKKDYLIRILEKGSTSALILKCADRISNLTDLHLSTHSRQEISLYLNQTKELVLPMAQKVNKDMHFELMDLMNRRQDLL